jgi:hypothetical protein
LFTPFFWLRRLLDVRLAMPNSLHKGASGRAGTPSPGALSGVGEARWRNVAHRAIPGADHFAPREAEAPSRRRLADVQHGRFGKAGNGLQLQRMQEKKKCIFSTPPDALTRWRSAPGHRIFGGGCVYLRRQNVVQRDLRAARLSRARVFDAASAGTPNTGSASL